ncbi:MAG: FKBP-type peptidyl-prolyl cis-trans isomerase [Treponema sp.]|jgi:FKBP-type peptidyl-prolyl cis-trans isomerase|nr:FKBP-type peptidyl-prolyl cis-trans isomerase [Treponema sp.]
MKKLWFTLIPFLGILVLSGCKGNGTSGNTSNSSGTPLDKDVSYALGMDVGSSLKRGGFNPDYDSFAQGLKDVLDDKETRFTQEEAVERIQAAFSAIMETQSEGQRQAEIDFLAENSKKPGIVITGSGLQYEVLTEGTGAKPAATDTVRVNYEGTFTDGTVFDSSYSRGEPAEFPLAGVIPGWTEGIQLMSEGSKYKFYISSDLGYGPDGYASIPPYSPLIFEVELLAIVK